MNLADYISSQLQVEIDPSDSFKEELKDFVATNSFTEDVLREVKQQINEKVPYWNRVLGKKSTVRSIEVDRHDTDVLITYYVHIGYDRG